jgi:SAM-dependent methyltransferase
MEFTPSVFSPVDSFPGNTSQAEDMATRPCPLCAGEDHRLVLELTDFQYFTDSTSLPKRATLRQVQCRHCLTLFLNPRYTPQGFAHLFAEAGKSYGSTALRPSEQKAWLDRRHLLRPGTVLLDVGCYEGNFLASLPDDLLRQGVDIDGPAIARGLARHPDIELVHSAFDQFPLSRQPQVITLFHVLEHLPEPAAVLSRLHAIAAPEARLVVEVPVLEYGDTNDINGFFSVQHITHFSRNTLTGLLNIAGWKILEADKIEGYNGYRVLAEKTRPLPPPFGKPTDITRLQEILACWHKAHRTVENKLTDLGQTRQVVIWGAGLHTEFLYQTTSLFYPCERRFLLLDSDPLKQGQSWRGIPIKAPSAIADIDWSEARLVISSYGGQPAIIKAAREAGIPENALIPLYDEIHVY